MLRRDLLGAGAGASLLALAGRAATRGALAADAPAAAAPGPFDENTVRRLAQAMAKRPHADPDTRLPHAIDNMSFDDYRSIRFRKETALWRGQGLDFQVEFLPRGFLYRPVIDMFEVENGQAQRVGYNPDLFTYDNPRLRVTDNLGFAGFRIHAPINRADYFDEVCVFLGASYFRAVAKGQLYGLSARGFANGTGDPKGEEFALFRAFWLEKPQPGMTSMVVHALLDGPTVTGAFRFTIRPGGLSGTDETVFDTESVLYPRREITGAGIAPLTGMFYFDANDRQHVDDARAAAHDSEGLSMWTGKGEQLWRPLVNPLDLQFSAFADNTPHGFGLMQRKRSFHDFEDLALNYEKRPSLWIEPIGDWGEGAVDLVELPTPNEVNDNIVAFWRPRNKLVAGAEYAFTYRMHWCWDNPWPTRLARIVDTRLGATLDGKGRFVMIDFAGDSVKDLPPDAKLHAELGTNTGDIRNVVVVPNPAERSWRVTFEFYPGSARIAELHCTLNDEKNALSEQWVYRWTP
ncbi:glucan biosynthesis protein [Rhizosaccharibacter radicis]|uniref:Glucan biosynthesis protein G n=1 Tax=Rhizosaccharibacter radicis TaxID=2782605 RepID=A0ABT1W154_9PROT|nr:glucan biosynthesis protein G [Acetobacteraceae bacterium KSS12]